MTLREFYAGRTCLVTGCGFVGSHLVDALLDAGAEVTVVSRSGRTHRTHGHLKSVAADLTDPEACNDAVRGAECLVHAAGGVGASGLGSARMMAGIALNVGLTANVVSAANLNGIGRVLLYGSSTAYPALEHPMREEELWDGPVYPGYFGYGWMRRYVERLGEELSRRSGAKVALVRPGALYGPRDNFDPQTSHVIAGLISRAVGGEAPFKVWGDGKDVRDILHVRDFARGCLLALAYADGFDAVNIAAGAGISTADLARLILRICGREGEAPLCDPGKSTALPYRVLDVSKAKARLGFVPEIPLADGLAETVAWFRSVRAGRSEEENTL